MPKTRNPEARPEHLHRFGWQPGEATVKLVPGVLELPDEPAPPPPKKTTKKTKQK